MGDPATMTEVAQFAAELLEKGRVSGQGVLRSTTVSIWVKLPDKGKGQTKSVWEKMVFC